MCNYFDIVQFSAEVIDDKCITDLLLEKLAINCTVWSTSISVNFNSSTVY